MNIPEQYREAVRESLLINRSMLQDMIEEYQPHPGHAEDVVEATARLDEINAVLNILENN